MPQLSYEIRLTEQAESVFRRAYEDARECLAVGDSTNSKVTHYRMLQEVLEKLIPHDPFSPSRALSGPLANIFRIKKGRIRICYIGKSTLRQITVLYISETLRKEGHKSDPYRVLTKRVKSGRYDAFFEELGLPAPSRKTRPAAVAG